MFYTHSTLPYCYSVVEMEAQSEHDADEALWSMLEFEQLLIFISSSLVMNFPLYIICKHNHICGVEVCEKNRALELSSIVLEIPNDAYTTLSQNLIGCSTLSQEYCKPIG